jgi:hypothetical protein
MFQSRQQNFFFGQAIVLFFHHRIILLLPEGLMCSKSMRRLKAWRHDVQALALPKNEHVLCVS